MRRFPAWILVVGLALMALGCSKSAPVTRPSLLQGPVLKLPVPGFETGSDYVVLNWSAATSADFLSYEIHILPDSTTRPGPTTLKAIVTDRNLTRFSVAGLIRDTDYIFVVRTVIKSGEVAASNIVLARTVSAETPPPACVTLLNPLNVVRNGMTLKWTSNFERNFLSYRLYIGDSANFDPFTAGTLIAATFRSQDTTLATQSLAPSRIYYFKVLVYNFANKYCASNEVFDTTSSDQDTIPPVAGQFYPITKKDVTGTSIRIRWHRNHDNDFAEYDIHMGTRDGFQDSASNQIDQILAQDDTTATVEGLKPASTYYFKIFVKDRSGLRSKALVNFAGTTQPPVDPSLIFGSFGTAIGKYNSPSGVVVDSKGRVFVSNTANGRIDVVADPISTPPDTSVVKSYGQGFDALGIGRPGALAIDSADNLFVCDPGSQSVLKISATGELLFRIGVFGSEKGQFSNPAAVALDDSGNIWVADRDNNRVQKFTPVGSFVLQVTRAEQGSLIGPSGLAFDPLSKKIFVLDQGNGRIVGFKAADGSATPGQIGKGTASEAPGYMSNATALTTDGAGRLLVCDTGNNRVQVFTTTGGNDPIFVLKTTTGLGEPENLEVVKFHLLRPRGFAISGQHGVLLDSGNHRMMICDLTLSAAAPSKARRHGFAAGAPRR